MLRSALHLVVLADGCDHVVDKVRPTKHGAEAFNDSGTDGVLDHPRTETAACSW